MTFNEPGKSDAVTANQMWDPNRDPLDTAEELGGWLPSSREVGDALRLRIGQAVGPDPTGVPFHRGLHSSMRQGMGLLLVIGLLATIPALFVQYITGQSLFTDLIPQAGESFSRVRSVLLSPILIVIENLWPAAILPAPLESLRLWWVIGAWVTAPILLLTWWLVGGLPVMVIARLIGAKNTLARFYASTAFAFLPLLLVMLAPLPVIGGIACALAMVLFVIAYARAVHWATESDWGRTLIALLLPAALIMLYYVTSVAAGLYFRTG